MGDESEAEGAVHAASFSIESEKQPVIVEKREKEDNPREHSPPQPANNKPDSVEKPSTVYVGRLSHETSERRLREFFETYGTVTDAKVRARGRSVELHLTSYFQVVLQIVYVCSLAGSCTGSDNMQMLLVTFSHSAHVLADASSRPMIPAFSSVLYVLYLCISADPYFCSMHFL